MGREKKAGGTEERERNILFTGSNALNPTTRLPQPNYSKPVPSLPFQLLSDPSSHHQTLPATVRPFQPDPVDRLIETRKGFIGVVLLIACANKLVVGDCWKCDLVIVWDAWGC